MKVQPNVRSAPGITKRWPVRLLLAGDADELNSEMMHRTFEGKGRLMIARSASLLGALERMQTERADIVLLSQNFRDEEVAAFLSNARRSGFEGLILRVASTMAFCSGLSASSAATGASPTVGFPNISSVHFMRRERAQPQQDQTSNPNLSFTARQRAVLVHISEGLTNGQVGRHLECTEGAIKATLQQIFKKLRVRKRSQVVRLAFEQRLLDDPGNAVSRSSRATNRVQPLLSPPNLRGKERYQVGDFVIDVAMHQVWVRGVETHLTPSEFELLEIFAAHPGELVRSSTLREMFWRNPTAKQDSLRVLVQGLRAKIEIGKVPQYIVTERNFGYRFTPSSARSRSARNFV
jgi:DNA-binding CsgD family transcriptional regulator/DNA-binding winged helix-turn-helix (wHTH) protein